MRTPQATLGAVIEAIGESDFIARTAQALCAFSGFDLAAVILHRPASNPSVLFDNFDQIGCRPGLEVYARWTHRINPMLGGQRCSCAVRACDFRNAGRARAGSLRQHLVDAPGEELGYRTIGWPEQHEEVGIYFGGWSGLIEFGLYRERRRNRANVATLRSLDMLGGPLASAFDRHRAFQRAAGPRDTRWRPGAALTTRETEISDLMLLGCSSDAIARRLSISPHTVKQHRKSIFRKLRVGSLAEFFSRASPAGGMAACDAPPKIAALPRRS
jgi:DNA-binding CsgD family transcriptional regulator